MATEKTPIFREHEIEWGDNKVSRLWDYYSRTPPFSEIYFSKLFGHHILRQSGLPLEAPLDVLDFGCGRDHLIKLGARWHYSALDFSPDSVSKVIEKANGHNQFKGAQQVSSLPADFPEAYFDVIFLIEVVEHLNDADLDSTLTEIGRLLKQGGVVVITTPHEEDLTKSKKLCPECGAIFHEWQHVRSWNVTNLSACLNRYEFSLRRGKTLDFHAQEVNVQGVIRKIKRIARRLLKGDTCNPHMIAVFQKV